MVTGTVWGPYLTRNFSGGGGALKGSLGRAVPPRPSNPEPV